MTATFVQTGQSKNRPWNFYYWASQGPYIRDGGNGQADSTAGVDDRQIVPVGTACAKFAPVVTAGPDQIIDPKTQLNSVANGDDELRDLAAIGYPNLFTNAGAYQPLVKYDQIHNATARNVELTFSNGLDLNKKNSEWGGICLGAALSSMFLKEPKPQQGTTYNVDELKGLWGKMTDCSTPNMTFGKAVPLGGGDIPWGPPSAEKDETDSYAPDVHDILEAVVKLKQAPLVCDLRTSTPKGDSKEVWNHAVWSFTATFEEAPGGNPDTVKISNVVLANADIKPPTAGKTGDRKAEWDYIITYGNGVTAIGGTVDWISVGGDSAYAPAKLTEVTKPSWTQNNNQKQNLQITEANVRKDDANNP